MNSPRLFSPQAHGYRFYFRMAVPKDLRSTFHRWEVKKRLPTNNIQTARLMGSYISSYLLDLFRKKRMHIGYTQTDNGNILDIKGLHLDCEEELRKMFESINSLTTQPNTAINAAEAGFNRKFKPNRKLKISEFFTQLSELNTSNNRWSKNLCNENLAIINVLIEVLGDKDLADVTFSDAELFFTTMQKLPKNKNKNPIFKGLSISQIIQLKPDPMSDSSINKYMERVCGVFKQAAARDYIDKNPFDNNLLRVKVKIKDKDLRSHFDDNVLVNSNRTLS
jgi:Domain of unknown function (DUF6538)